MTLRELLVGLRRSAVTILVFVLVGGAAAGAYIAVTQKEYTSQTRILVVAVEDSATLTQQLNGNQLVRNSIQSYADLVTSPTVLNPLVTSLGISESRLAGKITATVPLNTLFLDISVTDPSATRASQIASAVATQSVSTIESLQSSTGDTQRSPVQLTIVEPATTPSSASSPKPVLDLVIGLIVGFGIGLAVAGARGRFVAVPGPVYGVPPAKQPGARGRDLARSPGGRTTRAPADVPAAQPAPARQARAESAGPRPAQTETAGPRPAQTETAGPRPAQTETAGPRPAQAETAGPRPAGDEPAPVTATRTEPTPDRDGPPWPGAGRTAGDGVLDHPTDVRVAPSSEPAPEAAPGGAQPWIRTAEERPVYDQNEDSGPRTWTRPDVHAYPHRDAESDGSGSGERPASPDVGAPHGDTGDEARHSDPSQQ